MSLNDGILAATILPIYAGAVNHLGEEPLSSPFYERAMIRWDTMPNGELVGRANISVPPGMWHWAIYCFHPTSPTFYAVEKLAIPVVLSVAGVLALDCITTENIKPSTKPLANLPD